jgi:hypothetical protein
VSGSAVMSTVVVVLNDEKRKSDAFLLAAATGVGKISLMGIYQRPCSSLAAIVLAPIEKQE